MRIFIIVAVFVAVLLAVCTFVGAKYVLSGGGGDQRPVVRMEKPQRGELVEVVSAPGVTEPFKKAEIRSRISAQIVELPVDVGARVTKGNPRADPPVPATVLYRLDDKSLQADLRSAEARQQAQSTQIEVAKMSIETGKSEIQGIEINLAQAERDLKRQEELLKTNDVTESLVDKTRSQVEGLKMDILAARSRQKATEFAQTIAKHNLEAAEAEIARATESQTYTTINSPLDGVVTRRPVQVGETATGSLYNPGTIIIEVADMTKVLLKAEVDEADIAKVKIGQKAHVRIQAWPDEEFQGEVTQTALAHSTDRTGSPYFQVEVLLDNKDERILSGMNADVDIDIAHYKDVLKIPSQAVLSRPLDSLPPEIRERQDVDKKKAFIPVVFRVIDGKAAATPVKIGRSDATHTIILSGVGENDLVVTGPFNMIEKLQHDQKIKDEGAKDAGEKKS
jgi:HlyD family secretion protein